MLDTQYYVYILTNRDRAVLYTGVTSDLKRRVFEHKNHLVAGFTRRYNVDILVYYEVGGDKESAITREKQIKGMTRAKKEALINSSNTEWEDLYETI